MTTTAPFEDLEHALAAAERLVARDARPGGGGWTLTRVLDHAAESIECSVYGFPALKPAFVRRTVGRVVLRYFLRKGRMTHGLTTPIPGAPEGVGSPDAATALARLRSAVATFESHPAPSAEHFVYGPVTRDEYRRLHAMHLADHLGAFPPP